MKTYLITGANRGLGLEFCKQLSERGDKVLACCRKPSSASELQTLARDTPLVEVHPLDVASPTSVDDLKTDLADLPIDVVVNNAGVFGGNHQSFGSIDYDCWREVMETNVYGPTRVAEAFGDHLAKSGSPLLATVTSGMGSIGDNLNGDYYAYRTSKAAVNMVMRNAAGDLRSRRIPVVVINPGWVQTDMGGPNARITPEQSVQGMLSVLDGVSLEDTGTFFNYNGDTFPW